MKFWERFSRNIFKLAATPLLRKIRPKSIESVLKNSVSLLNEEMAEEIRSFIRKNFTPEGGFADRAGKCDLYYSLFGLLIAEAYSVSEITDQLKLYVKNRVNSNNFSGVHLYCGAILYAKLFSQDSTFLKLSGLVRKQLAASPANRSEYSNFMGYLALYYLGDFQNLKRLINRYQSSGGETGLPCPVTAANIVLHNLSGQKDDTAERRLKSFYRGTGGFAALKNAPHEDLLSTGVSLFALNFINADLRTIKPDTLAYIDGLYENGGFRATETDFETDVEYTFYGLLGLGALRG